MSAKSEAPSPKRLRDARRKGNIARSRLLAAAAGTAGGMWGLSMTARTSAARLHAWTLWLFLHPETGAQAALVQGLAVVAWFALPVLLGAFTGAFAASACMVGLRFDPSLAAPRWERVDPSQGLQRLFRADKLIELGKSLLLAAVTVALFWSPVRNAAPAVFRAIRGESALELLAPLRTMGPLAARCGGALLLLGLADFAWTRRRWWRDLMMTRAERREELKESEGDPRMKHVRRVVHQRVVAGGPQRGLAKASCVVVNPTHIAIALRFDAAEAPAPYLVAKGREDDALALRREAERIGLPVVRDVALARGLVELDLGEAIPEELYQAVAAVLKVAAESAACVPDANTQGALR